MADNVYVDPGSGANKVQVATDDVSGVQYPYVKLDVGADGLANHVVGTVPVSGTVTATGPLTDTQLRATAVPVSAASLPLPASAATSTKQSDGSQKSQIVDGTGNVIGATANALDVNIKSGSSSGTQYTEADVDATITGTAVLWEDTSDTLRAVSAAKPLPVNVVAGGAGDGSILDGVSSAIKATVLDYTNSNPLAVRLTDTVGDYVGAGAGTQYTEDAAAAADPIGTALIMVRADSPAAVTSADGDNVAARATNKGELYVKHVDAIPAAQSGTWNITNVSGTVSLPTGAATEATLAAIKTAAEILDNAIAGTEMQVDVVAALPAGGNTIGAVNLAQYTPATGRLPVDGSGVTQPVSAASLPLPSGAATSAAQTTGNNSVASIDTKTPALGQALAAGSVPVVLTASQITTLTPLATVAVTGPLTDTQLRASAVPVSGTVTANAGTGTMAVSGPLTDTQLRATAVPISGTVTASGPLTDTQLRATAVPVSVASLPSQAVTNAGTFAVQATVAATATNIAKAEDVASADADVGVPAMAVRKATPANTSGTDGDYEMLQMANGRLWASATIDAALPAGSNAIGKLAANDAVDIGDVTINNASGASAVNIQDGGNSITVDGAVTATLAAETTKVIGTVNVAAGQSISITANSAVNIAQINGVTPLMGAGNTGTGSPRVTIVSDQASIPVAATLAAETTKVIGTVNIAAGQTVATVTTVSAVTGGGVAHDGADSGNPLKVGGRAVSAEIAPVANNDRADFVCDLTGKQIVVIGANPENLISGAITTAMTGTTSTSLLAAPGAGLRNYITQITVSNAHATVGTDIIIQDGSGGTTLYTIPAGPAYGGASISFPVPLRQPTANTALYCANVTTGASTKVSASGFKGA